MTANIEQVMAGLEVLANRFGSDAKIVGADGGCIFTYTLRFDHEELTPDDRQWLLSAGWSQGEDGSWEIGV